MRRCSSRRATRCASSSSSSSSSNSSGGCDTNSSDERAAKQPADKLERLRRIFLSQPSKSENRAPRSTSAGSPSPPRRKSRACSSVARQAFESPDRLRSRSSSTVSVSRGQIYSVHEKDEEQGSSTDEEDAKQTQLSIDNHVHSLCEHAKRMALQHESSANQMHEMLDQAIEELQFLKKQEERGLQSQTKQIEENFALRLEVFEQQYVAKVAEIQREMQTAIQQQRARAEATILAAAKQLQEKTQLAVLPSPSLIGNHGSLAASTRAGYSMEDQPNRSSIPIRQGDHRSRANMGDWDTLPVSFGHRQPLRALRQQNQGFYEEDGDGDDADVELSSVDKQKAKLRALEAKLASFSQDSVDRIANELKSGVGLSRKRSFTRKPEREATRDQQMRKETSP